MFLMPAHRNHLLKHLPQNGKVVEIGVCKGDFSQLILTENTPQELHLIDPWEFQGRDDYKTDVNNVEDNEQEQRYLQVKDLFMPFTRTGKVIIHRDYSTNVAPQFEDKSLDWIFIDGLHSYDGVKTDLDFYKDKIKDDGFILGHDYTNHSEAQRMGFGVIPAVNEFIAQTDFKFLLMTWENYPTYVLCKDPESPRAQHLIGNMLLQCNGAVNLPDFPDKIDFFHPSTVINDQMILIPEFRLKKNNETNDDK